MAADRVTVTDENEGRLPGESGSTLRPQEVEMLREWIDRGAAYPPHPPFIPRRCPTLPEVKNQVWPRNAMDQFVLSTLESHGLELSPSVDTATSIRRVTLDLTGLPPTLERMKTFENESIRNPQLD